MKKQRRGLNRYKMLRDSWRSLDCQTDCKTDIESAFPLIPVQYSDHELLGYKWQLQLYYNCCLPFGCRSSPAIFERFNTAVEWIAQNHLNKPDSIHILDDFFMIGPPASENAQYMCPPFFTLCKKVGIAIKGIGY